MIPLSDLCSPPETETRRGLRLLGRFSFRGDFTAMFPLFPTLPQFVSLYALGAIMGTCRLFVVRQIIFFPRTFTVVTLGGLELGRDKQKQKRLWAETHRNFFEVATRQNKI